MRCYSSTSVALVLVAVMLLFHDRSYFDDSFYALPAAFRAFFLRAQAKRVQRTETTRILPVHCALLRVLRDVVVGVLGFRVQGLRFRV